MSSCRIGSKSIIGKNRRLALFFVGVFVVLAALYVLYSALTTLQRLEVVEAERDHWQKPSEVIRALDVRQGSSVIDLGSGAGYFALKLSSLVGERGKVFAVDLRRISLTFLWIREMLRTPHNIRIIAGEEDNPKLPQGVADAVLICNTYHEFSQPDAMLAHAKAALRSGGRLVIVDRGPEPADVDAHREEHAIRPQDVRDRLASGGFEVLESNDSFITGADPWWLIVARKP